MKNTINHEIRKMVRDTYGRIANSPEMDYGCSTTSCCDTEDKLTARESSLALGYSEEDLSATPEGAMLGLGCGNPQVIASLKPGETVLDLGSGGGFDCFLAARTVGAQGHVIGVDMTPEMIGKSRHQLANTDLDNVEFRLGEIEHLPVADAIVDVIISNCVINLSPEKEHVFKETFRVLRPGGRLAISDIIAKTELPEDLKKDMRLYTACVAGASSINQLESMLHRIGFEKIQIRPKESTKVNLGNSNPLDGIEDVVFSATIEAIKPWA